MHLNSPASLLTPSSLPTVSAYLSALRKAGVNTINKLHVLHIVRERGACSMSAVAVALETSSALLTGMADDLAARGLLTRETVHGDRRTLLLRLTPEGEDLLAGHPGSLPGIL